MHYLWQELQKPCQDHTTKWRSTGHLTFILATAKTWSWLNVQHQFHLHWSQKYIATTQTLIKQSHLLKYYLRQSKWESHVCTAKYVAYCMHFQLQTTLGDGLAQDLSHPISNCEPQKYHFKFQNWSQDAKVIRVQSDDLFTLQMIQ